MNTNLVNEKFQPIANNPPGKKLAGKISFFVRKVLDLQMYSVYSGLCGWLAKREGKLLEVGCGAQPYRHLVPVACKYTGLDWSGAESQFNYHLSDTIYYDGGQFPFEDEKFNNLFHTEVLEHIYDAKVFLTECHRVLKPSGKLFFTVPFQARYHYQPHDFFRYTPAALERILSEVGFSNVIIKPRGTDITVAAYKNISVIYRWLHSSLLNKIFGFIFTPILIPLLAVGHISLHYSLGSSDDCIGYTITANA